MAARPGSIAEALLGHAVQTPERPALRFGGATWTYRGLRDEAASWAWALRRWGLRPGDRAALFLENSATFVAAYLGVHFAGGIVVLVNTGYRQVELRHILSDAEVRLVISDPPRAEELGRVEADLPALEAVVLVDEHNDGPRLLDAPPWRAPRLAAGEFLAGPGGGEIGPPDPEAVAIIGYTSGTTGRAKGAMLRQRNLAANSAAVTEAWRWTADDRLLLTLPLFHVHGLCVGINGTLLRGSVADLRPRFDAGEVYDTLLQGETTMFFGVPTMYTRLIAEAHRREERPPPIRLYVSGSAPLSAQTFAEFAQLFGQPLLERYGMTETLMNLGNPYDGERRPGTVGVPFPGQEARLVEVGTRRPVADEGIGEIQVRGPHVFAGYWRRPDATAEAIDAEGWFSTGDLGRRSADGYYTISGRARELIISGGYNIYPREVEEVLVTHPALAEAAVLGMPDAEFGEQVVAVVVLRGNTAAQESLSAELITLCRDQLAGYKKPRRLVFVDTLPRNALGKVQKHVLKEWLETGQAGA